VRSSQRSPIGYVTIPEREIWTCSRQVPLKRQRHHISRAREERIANASLLLVPLIGSPRIHLLAHDHVARRRLGPHGKVGLDKPIFNKYYHANADFVGDPSFLKFFGTKVLSDGRDVLDGSLFKATVRLREEGSDLFEVSRLEDKVGAYLSMGVGFITYMLLSLLAVVTTAQETARSGARHGTLAVTTRTRLRWAAAAQLLACCCGSSSSSCCRRRVGVARAPDAGCSAVDPWAVGGCGARQRRA
jgi:hypothetical protein